MTTPALPLPLKCVECGRACLNKRSLVSHQVAKHGRKGKRALLRLAAVAVVAGWDALDSKDSNDQATVLAVTADMNKRVNALRKALDL